MILRLQCQCGALHGQVSQTERALRGVCYCTDCRAYSHHIGQASSAHDALGGVEFVATQARHLSFSGGTQHLACLSLSEKGLLRWYASCCNTAIGNTVRNWKFAYVGLVHTCLKADPSAYERAFPRLQMRVNTKSAVAGAPPGMAIGTITALMGFMPRVMLSGVSGGYRQTPFFSAPAGLPVVEVAVLSPDQRARAYAAASHARRSGASGGPAH
jgi:hypothetical protein